MTYIIAGKLNNAPFLIIDCMSTNQNNGINTYSFTNKLRRLESSSNTYYCLTGDKLLMDAISIYDYWLLANSTVQCDLLSNVHTDKKSISDILEIYKILFLKNHGTNDVDIVKEQRLFFITSTDVIIYNVKFEYLFEITNTSKNDIPNNMQLSSQINLRPSMINMGTHANIESYCLAEIANMGAAANINFKNRFTFIEYQNAIPTVKYPYTKLDDVIMDYYSYSYDKI